MIKFTEMVAQDFLTLGHINYSFAPDKVRLLLGRNEDSLTADDNGAGKSSLAEALRWCLYGETVRECLDKSLSVDHVIRRGQKRAVVTVCFEKDGNTYEVERERNRTTQTLVVRMSLNHGPLQTVRGKQAQEIVNQALGINVIQFSNLVYLDGSYPLLFAPSTDRTRKDILADLVDIAITQQMEEEVRQQLAPIQVKLDEVGKLLNYCKQAKEFRIDQRDRAKAEGQMLSVVCKKLEAETTQAETELQVRKDTVTALRTDMEDAQKAYSNALAIAEEELDMADVNLTDATDQLMQIRSTFLANDIEEVKRALDSSTREVTTREKRIKDIHTLQSRRKCPTCGQDTDEVGSAECITLSHEIEEIKDDIKRLKDALAGLEAQRKARIDDAATFVQTWRDQKAASVTVLSGLRQYPQGSKAQELTEEYDAAQQSFEKQRTVVEELKSELKTKRALLQQAKSTYSEAQKKLKEIAEDQKQAEADAAELTKQADRLSFWKTGFGPKGVPSLFIETVLPRISARIQHFANILTGGDVMVQLKAYRETKSNTIQEAIQIEAVNSKGASVYGANSTGERNRINLAVTLGLVDYFRSTRVFASNLLICDEVFDGLDATGVEMSLQALEEAKIPHVLVVSHHDHLKPLFENVMYACKKNGVATLEV